MTTIDTIVDTVRATIAEHDEAPLRTLDLPWYLWQALGGEALGVDADQWRALLDHIRTALGSEAHSLEIPEPAAVVAAAVLLDVPGEDVTSLIEDIDREVYAGRDRLDRVRVDAAYDQAGRLTTSLRSLLFVVTTIRPRTGVPEAPARTLVEASDRHRAAQDRAEDARVTFADAVRAAVAGGMSQVEVTRITGLSKQRVSQLAAGRK